jgi:hypothetical protein
MAQLPGAYMSEENHETSGFSIIPEGNYIAQIIKSEWKDTKAKNGKYIALTLKIVDGDHKGKVLFENLNLINPNPQAVEIATKTMNSICAACGKVNVEDTDELHAIPMTVVVKITPAKGDFPESNKISAYLPMDGEEFTTPWD